MTIDFDSKARQWDGNPVFVERGRKIAQAIRARVPLDRTMRALDYGCGTGLLSFPLKEALGHITLKDSSAGMLEVLREKIAAQNVTNMTVRQADLTAEPLPEERYDLIYSAMTLHHIPDTAKILRVFHALLNPGGYLCIADLDQEDGSFHGPEIEVHHGFDRANLAAQAEQAGFADIQFDTVFEIVKETGAGSRAYPVFLLTARRAAGRL
ncbi:methyltransferase family protein [Sulfuritortus calidifontis]|uniref:Methyltransferase family protein n=1 Tax=Sulfuritortus calidifontis TaxID=1914471 RepID=A0A4R3JZ47_9PROT|nr:class I SAM-dependent methyltransferase [Sulfuritortus calidifontis]TCS74080.1 methyltransferase family protein [Sulfuritortus calidifontis]